tara:strand:+ start:315 stop:494 length:180 start_codon:yes stop_codon:yes gene_type:complete
MDEMNITLAKYVSLFGNNISITATIDGVDMTVPICEGNRHYDEIMRQVDVGKLTIEEAD